MAIRNLKQYFEIHKEIYKHLSFKGNNIEIVLKGHLLIENLLERILKKSSQNPEKITTANLSFHKLACIVQAIFESKCGLWVWNAIFELNTIRNILAHNLEISEIDEKIDRFIEHVEEEGNGTIEVGDDFGFDELPMAIINVHSELWKLLDTLEP